MSATCTPRSCIPAFSPTQLLPASVLCGPSCSLGRGFWLALAVTVIVIVIIVIAMVIAIRMVLVLVLILVLVLVRLIFIVRLIFLIIIWASWTIPVFAWPIWICPRGWSTGFVGTGSMPPEKHVHRFAWRTLSPPHADMQVINENDDFRQRQGFLGGVEKQKAAVPGGAQEMTVAHGARQKAVNIREEVFERRLSQLHPENSFMGLPLDPVETAGERGVCTVSGWSIKPKPDYTRTSQTYVYDISTLTSTIMRTVRVGTYYHWKQPVRAEEQEQPEGQGYPLPSTFWNAFLQYHSIKSRNIP
ncbi:unnamed protein product [Tuber melanosporum]|uniref:(Perigord truffle) hypothetical protein n=1 Tax=Tuber melanosporum (strain Mel28) TaxID=656061 RepID=D5G7X6_TUBMM|nr:uncharacterized protein GSTUM_00002622001 [Tuber melanosporum]CAZ80619.1 unnamed protein product [Tuber melanosporum]